MRIPFPQEIKSSSTTMTTMMRRDKETPETNGVISSEQSLLVDANILAMKIGDFHFADAIMDALA
jgi:hypothetical protein